MRLGTALLLIIGLVGCTTSENGTFPAPEAPVRQETSGRSGEDRDPELSRDGKWLFFATSRYDKHLDIYRKRIGSNVLTRVTSGAGNERFPKVNPNPKYPNTIAFAADVNGEWDIFVIEDVVKNPLKWIRVSEAGVDDIHPSWSPDGSMLVYSSGGSQPGEEWILKVADFNTNTRNIHVLGNIDGLLPEWSPTKTGENANKIVFQRMRHRGNWFSSIWTVKFEKGVAKDLTMVFGDGDWAAINPSWSPDGELILFSTVAKSKGRKENLTEADDIWTVRANGTRPTQITFDPAAEWMPTWGPDRRIYFPSGRSGVTRIWSMEAPEEVLGTGDLDLDKSHVKAGK